MSAEQKIEELQKQMTAMQKYTQTLKETNEKLSEDIGKLRVEREIRYEHQEAETTAREEEQQREEDRRRARDEKVRHERDRIEAALKREDSEELKLLIRPVAICDGTTPKELRRWVKDINNIYKRKPELSIRAALATSTGRLATELGKSPRADHRKTSRDHVIGVFLGDIARSAQIDLTVTRQRVGQDP